MMVPSLPAQSLFFFVAMIIACE